MSASWYLVQYVSDIFRNEPRNVGVIVKSEAIGAARFIAEHDGKIDGRRLGSRVASLKAFKAWVEYIRYHLEAGTFDEQLERLTARSLDNYRIERRGVLLEAVDTTNVQQLVDDLFRDVVKDDAEEFPATLDDLANRVLFEKLCLPPGHEIQRNVTYAVDVKGVQRELDFDYRYINGNTTILEKVSLADQERRISARVNDLLFRMEHVLDADIPASFVALYDVGFGKTADAVEHHLAAMEKFSHTVNVREESAAERIGGLLEVPAVA